MAQKVLSCFNACTAGQGGPAGGAGPAGGMLSSGGAGLSADELPVTSLLELAPLYTVEGEEGCSGCSKSRASCARARVSARRPIDHRPPSISRKANVHAPPPRSPPPPNNNNTGAAEAAERYQELTAEFERVYGAKPDLFARAPGERP
jgi:hypothetical protein